MGAGVSAVELASGGGSRSGREVVALPGVELRLTAELALRAAIDTHVFSALRDLEPLDGGRAVQSVYVALMRRLPNVIPDRKRIAVDAGFSESSVKRAIRLLEAAKLVDVERIPGRPSLYHLEDLRVSERATAALAAIGKLGHRRSQKQRGRESRATSEPALTWGRVACEPTGRASCEPVVGSEVTPKEAIKNQAKQQRGAATNWKLDKDLASVLKRWGLESASYLVKPGDERAIAILTENPNRAKRVVQATMEKGAWSARAGVGARVAFLREHVDEVVSELDRSTERVPVDAARVRAKKVALGLEALGVSEGKRADGESLDELVERGLVRLGEQAAVCDVLRCDEVARERIAAAELVRADAERRLSAMTVAEVAECRERLFAERPGLRRLYGDSDSQSTAIRLLLLRQLEQEFGPARCEE